MKTLKPKKLIKILKKLNFKEDRTKGSHYQFSHKDGRKVTVPIHGNEEIGKGLLIKIIKHDLKLTKEEFEKQLKK